MEDLYVRMKLNEFEEARLERRARIMAEIEARESPPGAMARLVAPRLMRAGVWLERLGISMAGAIAQE